MSSRGKSAYKYKIHGDDWLDEVQNINFEFSTRQTWVPVFKSIKQLNA